MLKGWLKMEWFFKSVLLRVMYFVLRITERKLFVCLYNSAFSCDSNYKGKK